MLNRILALTLVAGLALATAGPTGAMAQAGGGGGSGTGPAGGAGQATKAADGSELLPIRKITLYRSGVGAFQRDGLVDGNSKVELKFDVTQINDILKSLQLLDLDGGRIDSVSYASRDPLARRLNSFSVPIADNPSLSMLLSRLRGSRVTLTAAEGEFTGTVLGVETRKVASIGGGKDAPVVETPFVTLVTAKGIVSININGVTNFNIVDKQLADELGRALSAVADSRGERTKSVDLTLSGNGGRRVVVRYVHEMPVWKTSYRLLLDDAAEVKNAGKDAAKSGGSLGLQGWAIVENTTDTDWKDVRLSLVSGRPVSFRMDLAEPLYMGRPEIAVPTIPGVLPKMYAAGTEKAVVLENQATAKMSMPAPASAMSMPTSSNRMAARRNEKSDSRGMPDGASGGMEISAEDLSKYSPQSQATAGEIGEVFFFEVTNPITVERQRSAMIPFLSANVSGRRVSIYNQNDRADHPMRGVEITNTSALQLLPGPLAVFDGTAYAGDATINQVSPGEKRLLAYAVDLDVAVNTKNDSKGDIVKVKIVNGAFEQTVKQINSQTYTFVNKDQKRARTFIVEHPRMDGWTLVAPAKPEGETQDLLRFEAVAEAGKSVDLTVRQERIDYQRVGLSSFGYATLAVWQKAGKLSDAVMAAFSELSKRNTAIANSERTIAELDRQLEINTREQTRVSETMQRLPQNGELYGDYTKELKELNNAIKPMRAQRKSEGEKLETLRREMEAFASNLNVE